MRLYNPIPNLCGVPLFACHFQIRNFFLIVFLSLLIQAKRKDLSMYLDDVAMFVGFLWMGFFPNKQCSPIRLRATMLCNIIFENSQLLIFDDFFSLML